MHEISTSPTPIFCSANPSNILLSLLSIQAKACHKIILTDGCNPEVTEPAFGGDEGTAREAGCEAASRPARFSLENSHPGSRSVGMRFQSRPISLRYLRIWLAPDTVPCRCQGNGSCSRRRDRVGQANRTRSILFAVSTSRHCGCS